MDAVQNWTKCSQNFYFGWSLHHRFHCLFHSFCRQWFSLNRRIPTLTTRHQQYLHEPLINYEKALQLPGTPVLLIHFYAVGLLTAGKKEKALEVFKLNQQRHPEERFWDFVTQLVNALDAWELDKWRVWVLNGLGCALDGIQVARRWYEHSGASTERRLEALLALAEPLFHSGLYKQAGKTYREAAALAYGGKDWVKIVKAEMGIVESDRVAGRMLRAWRRIERLARTLPQQAPPEERERVSSEIKLKRALLQRHPFRLCNLLRLYALSERIRLQVKQELMEATALFAREGVGSICSTVREGVRKIV